MLFLNACDAPRGVDVINDQTKTSEFRNVV